MFNSRWLSERMAEPRHSRNFTCNLDSKWALITGRLKCTWWLPVSGMMCVSHTCGSVVCRCQIPWNKGRQDRLLVQSPAVSVSRIMGLSRLSGSLQTTFLGFILQGIIKLVFAYCISKFIPSLWKWILLWKESMKSEIWGPGSSVWNH